MWRVEGRVGEIEEDGGVWCHMWRGKGRVGELEEEGGGGRRVGKVIQFFVNNNFRVMRRRSSQEEKVEEEEVWKKVSHRGAKTGEKGLHQHDSYLKKMHYTRELHMN